MPFWHIEVAPREFNRFQEEPRELLRIHEVSYCSSPMRFESKVHLATTSCGDLIATYGTPFYMKVDVEACMVWVLPEPGYQKLLT